LDETFLLYEIICSLVGNIFCDDDTHACGRLVYHMFGIFS